MTTDVLLAASGSGSDVFSVIPHWVIVVAGVGSILGFLASSYLSMTAQSCVGRGTQTTATRSGTLAAVFLLLAIASILILMFA
jgi:hypothetical protein